MDARHKYQIFCWGANSYGQLGLNSYVDHSSPQRIPSFLETSEEPLVVNGGGGHTVLLTDSGKLYVCGWNNCGQLGIGHTDVVTVFTKLEGLTDVTRVSCGWNHTLVVTAAGQCYSFGSNAFGQLGSSNSKMETRSVAVQGLAGTVRNVAAGMRHSVALTEDGRVFTWGCSKKGQLGLAHEYKTNILVPSQVHFDGDVVIQDVRAGAEFTAALSVTGDVYCWGSNRHGQCGLPGVRTTKTPRVETTDRVVRPRKINFSSDVRISNIHLGWSHVIAMTECGKALSWGRGDYGQLGSVFRQSRCEPKELKLADKRIESLSGGSEHNLSISHERQLLVWGWNEHGMCATGDEEDVTTPLHIPLFDTERPMLIGCGAGTSFVCTESDCGIDDHKSCLK